MADNYRSPEQQELIDALYGLQALHQMSGHVPEPALMGEELHEDCSIVVDAYSKDRIAITSLPVDEADFDGAAVWINNTQNGVEVDEVEHEVTPKDVLFWISKSAHARYFSKDSGSFRVVEPDWLARRITPPNIKPIPQSEYDPRYVPDEDELHKFEGIIVPRSHTYTLASGMFDRHLEEKRSLITKASGIVGLDNGISTTYDFQLTEVLPQADNFRVSEFDREFTLLIELGDKPGLTMYALGDSRPLHAGKSLHITVLREGFIVHAHFGNRKIHCVPSIEMRRLIDQVLHNAEHFEA